MTAIGKNYITGCVYFALLVFTTSSVFAFPKGATLPSPDLVQANRFSLKTLELPESTRVLVFYYSASWCAPCKAMSAALKKIYPGLFEDNDGLELVTYSVDFSPRARADYLRDSRFPWPAISPEVIDDKPWLTKIPAGTPKFQAFRIEGESLIALTEVGEAEATLTAAVSAVRVGADE